MTVDLSNSQLLDEISEPFGRFRSQFHASYDKRWRRACSVDMGGPMKLLLCSFVLAVIGPGLAFGQATLTQIPVSAGTLQTGFAVITPLSGTGEGLRVSEVFAEQVDRNFFQTSVVASPLITLTCVGVNANPAAALDIGIAIVNPN